MLHFLPGDCAPLKSQSDAASAIHGRLCESCVRAPRISTPALGSSLRAELPPRARGRAAPGSVLLGSPCAASSTPSTPSSPPRPHKGEGRALLPAPHMGTQAHICIHTHTHACPAACRPGCLIPSLALRGLLKRPGLFPPPGHGGRRAAGARSRLGPAPGTCGNLPSCRGCRLFPPRPRPGSLCLRHVYFLQTQRGRRPHVTTWTSDRGHHFCAAATAATEHPASQRPRLQVPLWVLRRSRVSQARASSAHPRVPVPGSGPGAGDSGGLVWASMTARELRPEERQSGGHSGDTDWCQGGRHSPSAQMPGGERGG